MEQLLELAPDVFLTRIVLCRRIWSPVETDAAPPPGPGELLPLMVALLTVM